MQPPAPTHSSGPGPGSGYVPQAKLSPPRAAAAQVARLAVAARWPEALRARVVLVRAPAGFGKTTAMRQMRERLQAEGQATAWLTLDAADNDVSRFLQCLGAAVRTLGVGPSQGAGELSQALHALAGEGRSFALFIDDFEVLHNDAVLGLVRQLMEQLPERGRLVIGSRALPALGLGRLRTSGQLLEIDAALLRFSVGEAEEFFRLRGCPLPREALARLLDKTEGWIGALWLASLALERHGPHSDFIERFSGSERAVADYLAEDVLAQQPASVRDFLLRTSILRTLDAQVCQALVPRADGAAMLQALEQAHLFLVPLADEAQGGQGGHSWRYHSMFADFLRAQLLREQPGELTRLHLAASGWYESCGRPVPAIEHALEGGDLPHALSLLARHAEALMEQGRMRLLSRWFSAMPAPLMAREPLLQAVAAYADCFTRGPWQAQQRLDALRPRMAADPAAQALVMALQPLLLAMMDRVEEAAPLGRQALACLPSCRPFADSSLTNAMAYVVSVLGDAEEAHRLLDAARSTQAGSLFSRMYTEAMEGVLDLSGGRLRQAASRFRVALAATPRSASYNPTNGNAWAGVLHAGVLYETNDLDGADHLLNVYLPLARDVGLPDHVISSYRMRARIAFVRGDVDAAFGLLTELEYLGHERQLPRVTASARLEHARIFVLQGNRAAASEALERADDPGVWPRVERLRLPPHEVEDIAIARLRWGLHFGDCRAVRDAIAPLLADAQLRGRRHRSLKLQVLCALAEAGCGDMDSAAAMLAQPLRHGASEGFVRLMLDEGPLLAPVLQRVLSPSLSPSQTLSLSRRTEAAEPEAAAHAQRLLSALGEPAEPADPPELQAADAPQGLAPATALAEPLTRKELRVLELLASGYSNAAMAEKLFVSDSTVRTHLRSINLKLGARSRTQAVALARELRVLR